MAAHERTDQTGLLSSNMPMELSCLAAGYAVICGTDEAGRGPLAGPVVAAAVVFRDCTTIWAARDSKQLSAAARERQYEAIARDLVFAIGICDHEEIDRINILQASLAAMHRAVLKLSAQPSIVLVDGRHPLKSEIPSKAIVHGDAKVAVIGAASIVAKVTRDRIMREYDSRYPEYGFKKHFGYPTVEHRRVIAAVGPCPIHRKTFRGVREYLSSAV